MKILFLLFFIILVILFVGKKIFNSAKKDLFKDQAAWSGKDIKINYTNSSENIDSEVNDNYLKMIAIESKIYLDDQSNKEEE